MSSSTNTVLPYSSSMMKTSMLEPVPAVLRPGRSPVSDAVGPEDGDLRRPGAVEPPQLVRQHAVAPAPALRDHRPQPQLVHGLARHLAVRCAQDPVAGRPERTRPRRRVGDAPDVRAQAPDPAQGRPEVLVLDDIGRPHRRLQIRH